MPRITLTLLSILVSFIRATSADAKLIDFSEVPYSAVGDGETDNRAALVRVFAAAEAGDTVVVPPGDYRVNLTEAQLRVPDGVAVWGQGGRSRFLLTSSGGEKDYREFLRPGSGVVLEGITIERAGKFPTVLLPLFGELHGVTLRNCRIIGNAEKYSGTYCHGIQVGVGTLKNLVLEGLEMTGCSYGLFQTNDATGTVDGVTVDRCRFSGNTSSDLEFNAPKGTMRHVVVRDCIFRDNLSKTPGGGFAVGFANVRIGSVENCLIENYGSEALHVEDRSENIRLVGNVIVGGSMLQPNGVVMVLSGSKNVRVERNYIDGRRNENRPHLILVTAGGDHFTNPSEVAVVGNVLVNGAANRLWYLQPGSGPEPDGNAVVDGNGVVGGQGDEG